MVVAAILKKTINMIFSKPVFMIFIIFCLKGLKKNVYVAIYQKNVRQLTVILKQKQKLDHGAVVKDVISQYTAHRFVLCFCKIKKCLRE